MTTSPRNYAELTAFLRSLGTAEVDHTGHDFLTHLVAVHDLLARHGCSAELAAAGLFHSIYGTERFQEFSLPQSEREQVRDQIGEHAEFIAWVNCVMDRSTFDSAVSAALAGESEQAICDRAGSPPISLTVDQLRDLATVHLFDWLEQVERSEFGWGYRRAAYREMATLVGRNAEALYATVFAREPHQEEQAAAGP